MSNYRRARVPGGTYFFTVNLASRHSHLLVNRIDLLRCAYVATLQAMPFECLAMVVLPDHLHAIWRLPVGDSDYSERWRLIKYRFSRHLGYRFPRSASKHRKGETGVWQRRFWEHVIRDQTDLDRHMRYCWTDPVRHGLVRRAGDWPHSSIQRDIRRGLVAPDWTGASPRGEFGELDDPHAIRPDRAA